MAYFYVRMMTLIALPLCLLSTACRHAETSSDSTAAGFELSQSGDDTDREFTIGHLENEGLRKVIYDRLKAQLEEKNHGTVHLGDLESFDMNVVRIMKDGQDITGEFHEKPDSFEIELSGWYQKHLSADASQVACFGFDSAAVLVRTQDSWNLTPGKDFQITSQDEEGCH